jgi:hypothetical protein
MKKLMTLFKLPSADEAARTQLQNAKRELLNAEAEREHATLKAAYQRGLILRLTRMINSGELA